MSKRTLFFFLALLLGVLLIVLVVPALLRALPTRYAMRLPEPLQALALPADPEVPLLPTAAPPSNAQSLLGENAPEVAAASGTGATSTPPPVPTAIPVDGQSPISASPTPTAAPTVFPTATPWPLPAAARMTGIVHQFQEWNNCGPATMAMALSYFGVTLSQHDTAAVMKPNPEDRNVGPQEMAAYVNEQTEVQALFRSNGRRELLQRFISNNIPVIIEVGIEPPGEFRWLGWYGHYLMPVAYDDAQQQIWVYDTWFGTSEEPLTNAHPDGRALSYADLEQYWPQFNRNYIILYRPEQGELVAEILDEEIVDAVMWQRNLISAQANASAAPNNGFAWFNLGTVYNELGEYEKAAEAFDQARALGLPWRMLWYQFGPYEAYYQVGRYEDVILLADTTLKDRPYFEESFYYKGLAQAAMGQTAEARENLQRAIEFNPNYTPAQTALDELSS